MPLLNQCSRFVIVRYKIVQLYLLQHELLADVDDTSSLSSLGSGVGELKSRYLPGIS